MRNSKTLGPRGHLVAAAILILVIWAGYSLLHVTNGGSGALMAGAVFLLGREAFVLHKLALKKFGELKNMHVSEMPSWLIRSIAIAVIVLGVPCVIFSVLFATKYEDAVLTIMSLLGMITFWVLAHKMLGAIREHRRFQAW